MNPLPAPAYTGTSGERRLGLAVESMKRHMTDEGWQLFAGLAHAGYALAGHSLPINCVDVPRVMDLRSPDVVVVQDKREWDVQPRNFRDPEAHFRGVECLARRPDVFKVTVLKDAHNNPDYHAASAAEMGVHAWVVYYKSQRVHELAPFTRLHHLIRTHHTVDATVVPNYSPDRRAGCLLSGAVSGAYPLRRALVQNLSLLRDTDYLPHPGYHRDGSHTPAFLKLLTRYKVAICTASRYGYALRKMIEATAAGCVVLTDMPADDPLPHIDGNLVRVGVGVTPQQVAWLVGKLIDSYSPAKQEYYAKEALRWYDYRAAGVRLANDIESMRANYVATA